MTDRSKLLALAEAVEKLSGPDAAIDSEIWRVVFGRQDGEDPALDPEYTVSLDAAMTLVPEGWGWTVGDKSPEPSLAWCEIDHLPWQEGYGWAVERKLIVQSATPALALCAAGLRAQAEALA